MEFINAKFNGLLCEVYFFKGWSTYSHPVTPTGAIQYEEALARKGFYRAWMCNIHNQDFFVYFEGIENKITKTDMIKPIHEKDMHFYTHNTDTKKEELGHEISANETMNEKSFYASLPSIPDYYSLITQINGISYEYQYEQSGKLGSSKVTDFDGNVKTFKY